MSDHALLGLFLTKRDVYDKYESTVPRHLLEQESTDLIADIGEWYRTHPGADPIVPKDIDNFWEWMKLVRHSGMAVTKLEAVKTLLKRAISASGGADAAAILKSLVLRDHAGRIAEKADRYSAGDMSVDLYKELLDDVEHAQKEAGIHNAHSQEIEFDVHAIMDNLFNLTTGLHWRSPSLEMALGPIRKGNFVMLAGFVDSGKTTLGTSEFTYMATQLPKGVKALWFNNEERGEQVVSRIIQSAIGKEAEWIEANVAQAQAEFDAVMGEPGKIVFIDSEKGPITPGLIRKKLREYNVGLMVFDQLYKIRGFKRNGDDKLGQLQDIFEYGRQLAKEYCPVIAIHQARGDANGLQKIEMHQLAGSQQALQGELDAIVTIGRDLAHPHMRYLYVPKNKLPTPGDKGQRNGFFDVQPKFNIARFDE